MKDKLKSIRLWTCALVALATAISNASLSIIKANLVTDANHYRLKDNTGADIPDAEWETVYGPGGAGTLHIRPSASKIGSSNTVEVTVRNTGSAPVQFINLVCSFSGTALGTVTIQIPGGLGPNATGTYTKTLPALPNTIRYGTLLMIVFDNTGQTGGIPMPIYMILDTPKNAMSKPWLGVIHRAVTYATGENSQVDAVFRTTDGMFDSGEWLYPADTGPRWCFGISGSQDVYNLQLCLQAPSPKLGNCVDVSCFLTLLNGALGVDFSHEVLSRPSFLPFTSNPIGLIGTPNSSLPAFYSSSTWSWHSVAIPTGVPTSIFDVCAAQAYDSLGIYYARPPKDWYLGSYWDPYTVFVAPQGYVNIGLLSDSSFSAPAVAIRPKVIVQ